MCWTERPPPEPCPGDRGLSALGWSEQDEVGGCSRRKGSGIHKRYTEKALLGGCRPDHSTKTISTYKCEKSNHRTVLSTAQLFAKQRQVFHHTLKLDNDGTAR